MCRSAHEDRFRSINTTVGDLSGNCDLIIGAYERLVTGRFSIKFVALAMVRADLPGMTEQNTICS